MKTKLTRLACRCSKYVNNDRNDLRICCRGNYFLIWVIKMFGRKKNDSITISEFQCTRDGLTIRGTEYRPAASAEKLPVAIVCHGFMAFQDTVRQYAHALAESGYVSYCFDFCGGSVIKGKSDGRTTDMSVLTEVRDLEAVMAYAASRPYTDPSKLLLMGCSQGGFVSALTAAKYPSAVSRLVLFYPALCIPDDARAGKLMFARFDPQNIPERFCCGPMKLGRRYPQDVMHMGPYEEISGYKGKVLLVHGTKDRIVNLNYSTRAAETYRMSGADVQFEIIEDGGHGFRGKHDRQAIGILKDFVREEAEGTV